MFTLTSVTVGSMTLTGPGRRDRDVATTWHLEHIIKSEEDIEAYGRTIQADTMRNHETMVRLAQGWGREGG